METGIPLNIGGIVPALVTPFQQDERIDFGAWQAILDLMIGSGVDGVFALGGQGEFFTLDEEEKTVALRFCRQQVNGRVPLYGNVGAVTTRESVRLARMAQAEGVDVLVVVTPYYLKPTQDELVEHFEAICDAVRLPVLAYNIPERTGTELLPDALRRLYAECPNFVGLKDSTGRLEQLPEITGIATVRPFHVFMGRDHMILKGLNAGCAGAVTACANVAPRLFVDLYRAWRERRMDEAGRLQGLIDPLRMSFGLHTFPAVVKEAMNMIGMPAGICRRPVSPMPEEARQKLAAVLEVLRAEQYLPEPVLAAK